MKTILVVEDDSNQRELYAEELSDDDHQVVCAGDGCEALQSVRDCHPDLMVLDINMPGMDGLQVLDRILEVQPQLPVIINTAYPSYQTSFMSWAAEAYVCKSSNLNELRARIEESLSKRARDKVDLR